MPNSEIVNVIYLLTGQLVRENSLSTAERALCETLPKLSRLVAVFGQQKVFEANESGRA
jgi:hypothetical protein